MKKIILLIFLINSYFSFCITYTTIANGNWNSPAVWSPSVPPNPLPAGDVIIINHNVTLTTNLIIDGSFTINSTGNLNGANSLIINSGGSFINSGVLTTTGDFDVKSGGTITNSGTITVDNFINTGIGSNSGTINTLTDFDNTDGNFTNSGNINAGDELINDNGTFVNSGTIDVVDDLNNDGGSFTNSGTLDIGDDLDNDNGTFVNSGTINVVDDLKNDNGTFTNNGTIAIGDDLKNDNGTFTNNGTITIVDDLKNENGTFIENNGTTVGGQVDNQDGTINGTGTLCANGGLDQDGSGILGGTIDVCNCNNGTNPVTGGGTIGIGVTFCTTLPIELIEFDANPENNYVNVNWITASEINNDYFVVERSSDGMNFYEISNLKGAGNSSTTLSYKIIDSRPLIGISYYRLKQVDFDGQYSYSDIESVLMEGFEFISVIMDDVTGNIIFTLSSSSEENASIFIFDVTGKLVFDQKVEIQKGEQKKYIESDNLSGGIYFIVFTTIDGSNTIKKKILVK